jgi:hypothetical protein
VDREDEGLKELFTSVGAQEGPPLGFSADGIARRGKRIRWVRRAAAAAGGLAVAGVITLSVALAANQPVGPATTPPATTTTEDMTPETTPETTSELPTTTVTSEPT